MSLANTTKTIKSALAKLGDPSQVDEEERLALLAACDDLKSALESPMEIILGIIFGPYAAVTVRIAIDIGLFDHFVAAPEGKLSVAELVEKTGMEATLLNRWLPLLIGYKFLKPIGEGRFEALPRAAMFATGSPLVGSIVHFGRHHETIVKLPAYFANNGYKNPTNAYDGPFQYAFGVREHFFEWLEKHPQDQNAFNLAMSAARQDRGQEWFEIYPVEQKLMVSESSSNEPSDVLIVDVGGGRGHDLIAFKSKWPNHRGRLILEDLPSVIDDVQEASGIELLKHDFFQPQPIRGAKAYYMRTVLHDWPDEQAKKILEGLRAAMSSSSLLLINEAVIPDSNMPFIPAHWDITMMLSLSALERTRQQWEELLRTTGFKVTGFYSSKNNVIGTSTLIEAVLDGQ